MVVVGEFEAEIIVDDAPLRELRDGTKTYVISKEGHNFQVRVKNNSNEQISFYISLCGAEEFDGLIVKPHKAKMLAGKRVSSSKMLPFVMSSPTLQVRVNQNNENIHPTIMINIYDIYESKNIVKIQYDTSSLNKATSSSKLSAPLIVTTGASKKTKKKYSNSTNLYANNHLVSISFWARSISSLHVDGILSKCWPSLFESDWGANIPTLIPPLFSCGLATVPISEFTTRETFDANQLDSELKKCGLHLKSTSSDWNLIQILSIALTGESIYHDVLALKFGKSPTILLQQFSNYYGVPIFLYQYANTALNDNSNIAKKLVVYGIMPEENKQIWPDKWVQIEMHEFVDLDDIEEEQIKEKERLNGIRILRESLKQQEEEHKKRLEELRKQEEEYKKHQQELRMQEEELRMQEEEIMKGPSKKIKTEKN